MILTWFIFFVVISIVTPTFDLITGYMFDYFVSTPFYIILSYSLPLTIIVGLVIIVLKIYSIIQYIVLLNRS